MDKAEENIYYEKREIKDRSVEYINKLFDDTRDDNVFLQKEITLNGSHQFWCVN